MAEARNDPPLQPSSTQDSAPVLAIDVNRSPGVGPAIAELGTRVLLDGDPELGGIELRVVEIGPGAGDVGGLGGDADAQAAVHVGADLEAGRLAAAARAAGGEGEPGEAVRDGL